MARKSAKRPPNDPEQYKRFREAAEKAEASDDPKDFERALKKVAQRRVPPTTTSSD